MSPRLRQELLGAIKENDQKTIRPGTGDFLFWKSVKDFFSPGRFAFVSVVLVLAYVSWMVIGISGNNTLQTELTAAISNEIGMNHTKRFKVDFEKHTITGLIDQMDKLDFTLSMPARLPQSLIITGARYCSIRGRIAAQIQMTDNNGHYYTLYQTKLVEPLATIEESHLSIDGVEYQLWHEDGVFFGFAGPSL